MLPQAFYAREAILKYIDDLEDLYLAEQQLGNIKNGKATFTTESK
jgi:RHH-type rel operon transcriptional repressor/antitoxin RelB